MGCTRTERACLRREDVRDGRSPARTAFPSARKLVKSPLDQDLRVLDLLNELLRFRSDGFSGVCAGFNSADPLSKSAVVLPKLVYPVAAKEANAVLGSVDFAFEVVDPFAEVRFFAPEALDEVVSLVHP